MIVPAIVCARPLACISMEALKLTANTRNMASPNVADVSSPSASTTKPSVLTAENTKAPTAPPPESKQSIWLRRAAIVSFWAVVVLLGLPVWWKTTAIYRAELPLQDMTDWAEGKVWNY